ncbi:S8 family serine peptidase [Actinomadura harenae]|uniref:Peptidase S8/S53 domain-containing protein n=1 Tax=Actinomadura harenae TaxID=2483351 RepID=A0A3M2LN99_9ACTN|nr:S8 family serine peptidase [Actinomadura harenae]RMI38899.1 hypothetical protein EBO15_31480 [Actinomadura harenae]
MPTIRYWRRFAAAVVASVIACNATPQAAAAAPSPRTDEWWFRTWAVQSKIWPMTRGAGVTVAVIDSGVNARLPELAHAVVPGVDLVDHSTDGRVDLDTESPGHGTATAAQISGQGGGSSGYVGLAPEAKVLPIRISHSDGGQTPEAIKTAVDHGAKVINMSYGADATVMTPVHCSPDLAPAIGYALQHDVVLVASSGNEGAGSNWPSQPASCPGVLAVGAVTKELHPWVQTERQNYVTIAAPGGDMRLLDKQGRMHNGAGTSSAAALTAAAVALIRAKNPAMPARTIIQRVLATARPVGSPGWNNRTGFGLLDISAAIDPVGHPVSATAPNPIYDAFERWQKQISSTSPTPKQLLQSPIASNRAKKSTFLSSGTLWLIAGGGLAATLIGVVAIALILRSRNRFRRA